MVGIVTSVDCGPSSGFDLTLAWVYCFEFFVDFVDEVDKNLRYLKDR